MATARLGSMRNVGEQPAQTVMRADSLLQVHGGCRRLPLCTARQGNRRSEMPASQLAGVKQVQLIAQNSHQSGVTEHGNST